MSDLKRDWAQCFAVAVVALVISGAALSVGMGWVAQIAGALAWLAALVGAVLGLVFGAPTGEDVQ